MRRKALFSVRYTGGYSISEALEQEYATGGRVSFADGSPNPHKPEGDDFVNELMFKFDNIDNVTIEKPTCFCNARQI